MNTKPTLETEIAHQAKKNPTYHPDAHRRVALATMKFLASGHPVGMARMLADADCNPRGGAEEEREEAISNFFRGGEVE